MSQEWDHVEAWGIELLAALRASQAFQSLGVWHDQWSEVSHYQGLHHNTTQSIALPSCKHSLTGTRWSTRALTSHSVSEDIVPFLLLSTWRVAYLHAAPFRMVGPPLHYHQASLHSLWRVHTSRAHSYTHTHTQVQQIKPARY